MKEINITLDEARELFNSGNTTLKELALKAFNRKELVFDFRKIKTFEDACKVLYEDYVSMVKAIISDLYRVSRASAAMFEVNIIRKVLNLGYNLQIVKNSEESYIYYPDNPITTIDSTHYNEAIASGEMSIVGKIITDKEYYVLGGTASKGAFDLSGFNSSINVGFADANIAFLGCATKEIAQHFGKYFGMHITIAKYGDVKGFRFKCNV